MMSHAWMCDKAQNKRGIQLNSSSVPSDLHHLWPHCHNRWGTVCLRAKLHHFFGFWKSLIHVQSYQVQWQEIWNCTSEWERYLYRLLANSAFIRAHLHVTFCCLKQCYHQICFTLALFALNQFLTVCCQDNIEKAEWQYLNVYLCKPLYNNGKHVLVGFRFPMEQMQMEWIFWALFSSLWFLELLWENLGQKERSSFAFSMPSMKPPWY